MTIDGKTINAIWNTTFDKCCWENWGFLEDKVIYYWSFNKRTFYLSWLDIWGYLCSPQGAGPNWVVHQE